jgi:hypothetical protein
MLDARVGSDRSSAAHSLPMLQLRLAILLLLQGLLSFRLAMNAGPSGQVFVCTNKFCREKGSDATLATFNFLTPQVSTVLKISVSLICPI